MIGLLLQLAAIYLVAFTNGGLAVWTLGEMITFVNIPQPFANLTLVHIGCTFVVLKYY